MSSIFFFADIVGIIAFSISGFLVAIRNQLDILGILIASSLTALGGGVLRDAILSRDPFAFTAFYPSVVLSATILILFVSKLYKKETIEQKWIFVVSDTMGLVAFSITGSLLAIDASFNTFGIIILGFVTAVGGGVIRDIMINRVPAVLVSDFYGSIAIIVSLLVVLFSYIDLLNEYTMLGIATFSVALRLLAYKQKWHLPKII
ncbi:MAG: trimeric intracellular cation channel family protein [Sulfuricurvum sp.]